MAVALRPVTPLSFSRRVDQDGHYATYARNGVLGPYLPGISSKPATRFDLGIRATKLDVVAIMVIVAS